MENKSTTICHKTQCIISIKEGIWGEPDSFFYYINRFAMLANARQITTPIIVGIIKETAVHLRLPVSFLIVKSVVEQGQCINENSIVLIAVIQVHPLSTKSCFKLSRLSNSKMVPCDIYAIIIIGRTISLAGNPSINAIRITPSRPIYLANGSKNSVQWLSRPESPTVTFARIHIKSPAGAAIIIARPSTNKVLSKIERIITLAI